MGLKKIVIKSPINIMGRDRFPRPDFIRSPSYLLDGEWHLCPDSKGTGMRKKWYTLDAARMILDGENAQLARENLPVKVMVPFPLESEINQKFLAPIGYDFKRISSTRKFWYFKRFKAPDKITAGIIRFGAIDYKATVWLNGILLGQHEGGYTPFSYVVNSFREDNILAILVEDSLSMNQIRGKQTFLKKPFIVWYKGCTGIWQSVWIESLNSFFIEQIITKRISENIIFHIDIKSVSDALANDLTVEIQIYGPQVYKKRGQSKIPIETVNEIINFDAFGKYSLEIILPDRLFDKWSPDWPAVHPIEIVIKKGKKLYDRTHLLFGHRNIEIDGGVIKLNNKKLYQKLLLNQGYYPAGHYTPESTEQFKEDIELMKKAGFNGCRMHQKIESPAFLYWADIYGFLIWEEMPSYYIASRKNLKNLEKQLDDVIQRDILHPSIITLVLFNESWGLSWGIHNIFLSQKARNNVVALFDRIKEKYPGYLVIDNSGFHHIKTDIADIHHYIKSYQDIEEFYAILSKGVREAPLLVNYLKLLFGKENVQTPYLRGFGEQNSPLFISEFGGYGFSLYKHEDSSLGDFLRKHIDMITKSPAMQGFCYTQFTDTFDEKNGLFTFARVPKIDNIYSIIGKRNK